jgi:hypothetical protein
MERKGLGLDGLKEQLKIDMVGPGRSGHRTRSTSRMTPRLILQNHTASVLQDNNHCTNCYALISKETFGKHLSDLLVKRRVGKDVVQAPPSPRESTLIGFIPFLIILTSH